MLILGIESSCDDTSAAVIRDGKTVLSNIVSGQEEIHNCFGGVVPELASRSHLTAIQPVVEKALAEAGICLNDIDLIAATQGPGLTGSLLVGFSYAKALSTVTGIPYVGVDHMVGHILAAELEEKAPEFPYIALICSGGTSALFLVKDRTDITHLGRTRDDAAGEAFDKVAKILGLPYPGGPHVSRWAENGDPKHIKFPRAWLDKDSLDFSFSGLKTAVLNYLEKVSGGTRVIDDQTKSNICASFEEAVIEVLVTKALMAAKTHGVNSIVVGGGVSANRALRARFERECTRCNKKFFVPSPQFCTDNAAMIALAGYHKFALEGASNQDDDVYSRSSLG